MKAIKAIAAVMTAAVLSGCSVNFGTNPSGSDIVAKPTTENYPAEMEISYSDFAKQYAYMLDQYGVEDDEEESVAEACKNLRQNIIDNMITERIFLQKAKELGLDTLTEEELAAIKTTFDEQVAQSEQHYAELAQSASETELSDEEKANAGREALDLSLEKCGITRDDLYEWLKNYNIAAKVTDSIVSVVTEDDAKNTVDEYIKQCKTLYSDDREAYISQGCTEFWLPDEARNVWHIFLGFDEDTANEITTLRESDNAAADELVSQKAEELSEKQAAVLADIEAGIEYSTLLLQYASNPAAASYFPGGYPVVPEDTRYDEKFVENALSIPAQDGKTAVYTDDSGVHILVYAGAAAISEEKMEENVQTALANIRQSEFNKKLNEWTNEFKYETDSEKLNIGTAE